MSRSKSPVRVYCPGGISAHGTLDVGPEQSHHLVHVLRLTVGEPVIAFDGSGDEYEARIERVSKSGVVLKAGQVRHVDRESPLEVILAQGISSGERMDYTVQKAVELGVHAIQPLATERSIVRLDSERAAKRVAHWQSVAIAACEQCGRNRVPPIHAVSSLGSWLGSASSVSTRLTLMPAAQARLADIECPKGSIVLLVGPEGGLSAREHEDALSTGFVAARLGPRVLRTETAAVAALAAMQTLWGDF